MNFGYEITQTEVSIYEITGRLVKRYKAEVSGLNLPASGVVLDGFHFPDKTFGSWKFFVQMTPPKSIPIPEGINLTSGDVEVISQRTLSKGSPQTISQVRDNRGIAGGSEYRETTTFRQNGENQEIRGILLFPLTMSFTKKYVLHGRIWDKNPNCHPAPKWLIGLH